MTKGEMIWPTMKLGLQEMAKIVEALRKPCRRADVELYSALEPNDVLVLPPHFTENATEAMTLVPPEAGFEIERLWIEGRDEPVWRASIYIGLDGHEVCSEAYLMETAICAAALRAKAAILERGRANDE